MEFDRAPASIIRLVRFLHGCFGSSCNCADVNAVERNNREVTLEIGQNEPRECLENMENELINSVE